MPRQRLIGQFGNISSRYPLTTRIMATGHRSLEQYNTAPQHLLKEFALRALDRYSMSCLISGFALGWDLAIAEAALEHNIPLIAAIPFPNQPSRWPAEHLLRWKRCLDAATEIKYIQPSFKERNLWMAQQSRQTIAMWDGKPSGTSHAIKCAEENQHQIINLYSDFFSHPSLQESIKCPSHKIA